MFTPAVITSKAAQTHMDDLKVQHGDVLNAMAMQRERLLGIQQQKDEERARNNMAALDLAKVGMVNETQRMNTAARSHTDLLKHQQKTQELDIKRDALTQV